MKNKLLKSSAAALIIISAVTCSKKIIEDTKPADIPPEKTGIQLEKEYTSEGFIDRYTFRVVIIGTKEECESDENSIEKKTRNRTISTLQKFLESQGKTDAVNMRAGILNVMNEYGRFYKKDPGCSSRNIYYFEIKKEGIKTHILGIAGQR